MVRSVLVLHKVHLVRKMPWCVRPYSCRLLFRLLNVHSAWELRSNLGGILVLILELGNPKNAWADRPQRYAIPSHARNVLRHIQPRNIYPGSSASRPIGSHLSGMTPKCSPQGPGLPTTTQVRTSGPGQGCEGVVGEVVKDRQLLLRTPHPTKTTSG